MARLLILRDPLATGRPNAVQGEVVAVTPDDWSGRKEAESYDIVILTDVTVAQAEAKYTPDGVPAAVRNAETQEMARFRADCTTARASVAPQIPLVRQTAAAQAIDEAVKKSLVTIPPNELAAIGVAAADAAERNLVQGVLAQVLPLDVTKLVRENEWPCRCCCVPRALLRPQMSGAEFDAILIDLMAGQIQQAKVV